MACRVIDWRSWRITFLLFLRDWRIWIVILLLRVRRSVIGIRGDRSLFLSIILLINNCNRSFIIFLMIICWWQLLLVRLLCLNKRLKHGLAKLIIVETKGQHKIKANWHLRNLLEGKTFDKLGHVDVLVWLCLTFQNSKLALAIVGAPSVQVRILINDRWALFSNWDELDLFVGSEFLR